MARESAWHRLDKRIDAIEHAFEKLSEVVLLELDEVKAAAAHDQDKIAARFRAHDRLLAVLEKQCNRVESKSLQLELVLEKKVEGIQAQLTRVSVAVIENEAERQRLSAHVDGLMVREGDGIRKLHALQANLDQMGEWLQRLKEDSTVVHAAVHSMNADHSAAIQSLTADTTNLAKELGTLRAQSKAQSADCLAKLNAFSGSLERQRELDRSHCEHEIAVLREALQTTDATCRTAVDGLLKNASRVRNALDEGMSVCSTDVRLLREEVRTTSTDVRGSVTTFGRQLHEMQDKVSHLLHAVQSLAGILHLTTPL
ncbi:hypothetical protein SDRG_10873 [Saprolegnia diclina VS20]|uniref:Uncharacterized protein n=1 Tax=Saprolegnia diclina (strain VS20) TaxID=1156394 RepID=T0RG61_SAPDV|nr:hypothetical protein SDRG_10873 [Saprolegnia diclina VS20]EQC31268.1 hypothetical protein SDRG_10873 [Saprolegnia diclina VS20]|eukprot:XP_008615109.1 hypothetical protein SDRG_10873 [Saprolegnia diclina VS20]